MFDLMPLILILNSFVVIRWPTIRVINVGIDVELKRKEKKRKEDGNKFHIEFKSCFLSNVY